MRLEDYAIRIEPLPKEEGGGFMVTVPDLPGCMADGETIEDAMAEGVLKGLRRRLATRAAVEDGS